MIRPLTIAALVSVAAVSFAADFTTKPAKDAQAIYVKAVARAEESHAAALAKADREYSAAMDAARRDYVSKLEEAGKRAAMDGNVDEAVKIQGEVKAVNESGAGEVDRRTLWVHKLGAYHRLESGKWIEVKTTALGGNLNSFNEVERTDDGVTIASGQLVIRLYQDRSECISAGVARPEWSYAGAWVSAD
ncbi:MAG: hypothetical protein R3B90_16085 [Planctomycetaceae bacterium]